MAGLIVGGEGIGCRRRTCPSRRRDLIDRLRCCPHCSRSHRAPRSRRLSSSSLLRSRGHENRSGAGVNFIPNVSHAQSVEQACVVWQVEYTIVVLGDSGVRVTIILQSCPAVFTSAGIERNLSLSLSLILISFTTVHGMKMRREEQRGESSSSPYFPWCGAWPEYAAVRVSY